jgi:nucleoporin p58/p45
MDVVDQDISLTLSTSSAPTPPGAVSSQPAGGSLFGGFGPVSTSQPQQQGGLFGSASSQPIQSGGLFGSTTSQPSTGGLFGSANSQPVGGGLFGATTSQTSGAGLFGTASSQPSQSGGLFGPASSQPSQGGGLFGTTTSQPAPSSGISGSASQSAQGGGLFGTTPSQPAPSGGLFGGVSSQPSQVGGIFGAMAPQPTQAPFSSSQAPHQNSLFGGLNQSGVAKPAATLNLGQQPTLGTSTSSTRIDLDHLRPTTKFDQLTEDLQKDIINLDTTILNEINRCSEVSNLLPVIAASGSNIPNDVAYVTEKLEEVETGLENDAGDIQKLKEDAVKKDVNEAKICFREMDRLKMPSQYQVSVTGPATSVSAGVYGGHGLSGWWNHPQTLQRSRRGDIGAGGSRALEFPGDEEEDALAGRPANLVDFFDRRIEEMGSALVENRSLLAEIEEFVSSVEAKIAAKQREVAGRHGRANGIQGEEDQVGLLRYVFGEFERSLYEVADKVGGARDGVQELVMGGRGQDSRRIERLGW